MSADEERHLAQIDGDDLARFAQQDSDETKVVLVELDLQEPVMKLETSPTRGRGGTSTIRRLAVEGDDAESSTVFKRVNSQLSSIAEGDVVQLPAAHAFAVEVNPRQLRSICELEGIKRLSLSRTRGGRVSGSPRY
ncbi:MAG: hypothetical protein AAGF23_05865 [Acidobacteriota bacterium]